MRIGKFFQLIVLILLAAGAQPAYSALWQWSLTASNNATADPTINWSEGQSPSSINDSARAMMARTAEYRNDIGGALRSTGTSTAYVIATNQGNVTNPIPDGFMFAFIPHVTNGPTPFIQVDGASAHVIVLNEGDSTLAAGTLVAGTPYRLSWSTNAFVWVLQNVYGNPFNLPLGGLLHSTLATAPNSNFVVAGGQCISTTTYAAYWVALGSPASGSCSGGQFAVLDTRGRSLVALDTMGPFGAAGRLTSSGTGCGTAMTSMGASCANGLQSEILSLAQIPTGITSAGGALGVTGATTVNLLYNGNVAQNLQGGTTGFGWSNSPTVGTAAVSGSTAAQSVTSNNTGGGSHPTVDPNIAVYIYIRVL